MSEILVRRYTKRKDGNKIEPKKYKTFKKSERVLVFDTETTIEAFQNLKIGFFQLYDRDELLHQGLFYERENLTQKEVNAIGEYIKENNIALYTREDFVHKIFYREVYDNNALCIGFNLFFDLMRLLIGVGEGEERNKGAFSVELSKYKNLPRLIMRDVGNNLSFINFGGAYDFFKKRNKKYSQGYFLDLATLACIFLDKKKIKLKTAGEAFNTKVIKIDAEHHGTIDKKYIEYCINDVKATYALYVELMKELKRYEINIHPCSVYSSAGLGKYALHQMGIKPLNLQQPDFPLELKEYLTNAYYGGRCELTYRRKSVKVTTLDFLSMYPSLTILMDLWNYIIADKVVMEDATNETIEFLKKIDLNKLQDKEIWKHMCILVKLVPEEDCLPARMCYKKDSDIPNIGINYLTYGGELYYALPDVIASVLITGKIPKITKAIRFIPKGIQSKLKPTRILGFDIDPRTENFFKKAIEKRQEIKNQLKNTTDTQNKNYLDGTQKALKILASATTYGIFMEMRRVKEDVSLINFDDDSDLEVDQFEEEGEFFNPLIAVMEIAGARLFLTMAEQKVKELGERHYYCDTDSFFVPPHVAKDLQEYFQPLSPYSFDDPFFKIEKENLWFYGISSKRYVLYDFDGKNINIYETDKEKGYKLHGLGHLKDPFDKEKEDWHKDIWLDILKCHYGFITKQNLQEKYSKYYAVSSLTVSTISLWHRFKELNNEKDFKEQIKPANFFLIGVKANGVKPIAPFSKKAQQAVHLPFIDYETGKILQGEEYWGTLWDVLDQYMNHPESKFNGEDGFLERRHIKATGVEKIGKEIIDLDQHLLKVKYPERYLTFQQKCDKILNMTIPEARNKGVSRSTFWDIQQRVKKDSKSFKWDSKAVRKLLK